MISGVAATSDIVFANRAQSFETLNGDITALLQQRYGINMIPVQQVVQAPSYAKLEAIDDENTQVEISRSYAGTKNLIPTSFSAMIGSISSTFAADRPDARLMRIKPRQQRCPRRTAATRVVKLRIAQAIRRQLIQ